jgi:hypothetical protein
MSTESFEEMMKNWMDNQKKLWDGFFDTVQGFEKPQSAQTWEHVVALSEETFKKSSQAQTDWVQMWVRSLTSVPGLPNQASESAKQFQEMYQRWNETQERLWSTWFAMLKGFDPSKGMGAWAGMSANPFQMWQESTRKMVDAQFEWMRMWMGQTRK